MILSVLCLFLIFAAMWFYHNHMGIIFNSPGYVELRADEVSRILSGKNPACDSADTCAIDRANLKKGDILMRRYVNDSTRLPLMVFKNYFSHVAAYVGDGMIVEAVGNMPDNADEVTLVELEKSDWILDKDKAEAAVIFRPRFDQGAIDGFSESLKLAASNSQFHFGIRKPDGMDRTTVMCTTIVTDALEEQGMIERMPYVIAPDYLFIRLVNDGNYELRVAAML